MKTLFKKLSMLAIACCLFFSMPAITVYAGEDLDGLTESSSNSGTDNGDASVNKGVSDYLKGYTPVTDENMQSASVVTAPIVKVIGNLIGAIVILGAAAIMLITGLDLLYIGVPPLRPHLNPAYGAGAQGGGMSPMGGMGGFGMRGGMMGGMGGSAQPQATGRHCWVSDEAIACTSLLGQQSQPAGGMSPMGGMGGMGMMGGGMMGGGMMGGAPQQPQQSTKSVILMYFKKRVFFIVLFTICLITLTSSIFTDCGINLAELLFKIMAKVNSAISGVSI